RAHRPARGRPRPDAPRPGAALVARTARTGPTRARRSLDGGAVSGAHGPAVDPATPLDGPLERLAPETKLVGAVAFLVAAVATPPGAWWAWALDAAVAAALAVVALVPAPV